MFDSQISNAVLNSEQLDECDDRQDSPIERVQPENRTFGFPTWIWHAMFTCYALFFVGLLIATGNEASALMMIVISILYTMTYFSVAYLLTSVGAPDSKTEATQWQDGKLQTIYGGLSMGSVAAQVLIVPAMIAFFGLAIAVISTFVA